MLPPTVEIVEVGPRDGFQSVKDFVPTTTKISIIKSLIDCGVAHLQVTSFVSPKAIPQMRDAGDVYRQIAEIDGKTRLNALVPNARGAQLAYAAGVTDITFVISVTEGHNLANTRRSVKDSFTELQCIIADGKFARVKLDLAMVFGCPFEGEVPVERVLERIFQATEIGVREICLCDTIGSANPELVRTVLRAAFDAFPAIQFRVHFHDTRGLGVLNNYVAYECGIATMESSIGGIGGCPFAPGAAGNTATEDLAYLFHSMAIATGLDLPKLTEVAKTVIGATNPARIFSHLAQIQDTEFLRKRIPDRSFDPVGHESVSLISRNPF